MEYIFLYKIMNTEVCDNEFSAYSLTSLIFRQQWSKAIKRIESYPEEVNSWDSHGCLPLHRVCQSENSSDEVIEKIILTYPSCIKEVDKKWGRLPIHYAVRNPNSPHKQQIVKILLQKFPEGASFPDKYNDTPLHYHLFCSREQSLEIVKMLVEAHPNTARINAGFTGYPLHRAVVCDNLDIVKYLIGVYPEVLRIKDLSGRIPREHVEDRNSLVYKLLYEEELKRFGDLINDSVPTITVNEWLSKRKRTESQKDDMSNKI